MSRTLNQLSQGSVHGVEKSNLSQVFECSSITVNVPASLTANYQHGQAMSLFASAVIHFGQINISIADLGQKLRLSPQRGTEDKNYSIQSTKRFVSLCELKFSSIVKRKLSLIFFERTM